MKLVSRGWLPARLSQAERRQTVQTMPNTLPLPMAGAVAPPTTQSLSFPLGSHIIHLCVQLQPTGTEEAGEDAMLHSAADILFSPLERQVIDFIRERGPSKGGAIGTRLGMADARGYASSKLAVIISNLCERNILTMTDDGYQLSERFLELAKTLLPLLGG